MGHAAPNRTRPTTTTTMIDRTNQERLRQPREATWPWRCAAPAAASLALPLLLALLLAMAMTAAITPAAGAACAATTYSDGYVYTKENGGFAIADPGWSVSGSSFTTEVWLRNEKRGSVQCWWGQVSRNRSSSSDARCATAAADHGHAELRPPHLRRFAGLLCCCAHCRAHPESTVDFCPSA